MCGVTNDFVTEPSIVRFVDPFWWPHSDNKIKNILYDIATSVSFYSWIFSVHFMARIELLGIAIRCSHISGNNTKLWIYCIPQCTTHYFQCKTCSLSHWIPEYTSFICVIEILQKQRVWVHIPHCRNSPITNAGHCSVHVYWTYKWGGSKIEGGWIV